MIFHTSGFLCLLRIRCALRFVSSTLAEIEFRANANVLALLIRGYCQKYWILQWNEPSGNVETRRLEQLRTPARPRPTPGSKSVAGSVAEFFSEGYIRSSALVSSGRHHRDSGLCQNSKPFFQSYLNENWSR